MNETGTLKLVNFQEAEQKIDNLCDQVRRIMDMLPIEQIVYTKAQASKILGYESTRPLDSMAHNGTGPKFICHGNRRLYSRKELLNFISIQPTFQSLEEYYRQHPELRPVDPRTRKIKKE